MSSIGEILQKMLMSVYSLKFILKNCENRFFFRPKWNGDGKKFQNLTFFYLSWGHYNIHSTELNCEIFEPYNLRSGLVQFYQPFNPK